MAPERGARKSESRDAGRVDDEIAAGADESFPSNTRIQRGAPDAGFGLGGGGQTRGDLTSAISVASCKNMLSAALTAVLAPATTASDPKAITEHVRARSSRACSGRGGQRNGSWQTRQRANSVDRQLRLILGLHLKKLPPMPTIWQVHLSPDAEFLGMKGKFYIFRNSSRRGLPQPHKYRSLRPMIVLARGLIPFFRHREWTFSRRLRYEIV